MKDSPQTLAISYKHSKIFSPKGFYKFIPFFERVSLNLPFLKPIYVTGN